MVDYRRNRVPGGCYFFTVTLQHRRSQLLTNHVDLLRKAMGCVQKHRRFTIDAIVILPEHIHAVWTLPPGDSDYSGRWRSIKSRFTQELVKTGVPIHPNARGEYSLWQRRFWEHTIRDDRDFEHHVNYIHYNPVKHGHVDRVRDWPPSSFHKYVREGLLPLDWGDEPMTFEGDFGE